MDGWIGNPDISHHSSHALFWPPIWGQDSLDNFVSEQEAMSILVVLVLVWPGITQCCDEVNTLLIAHASLFWFEGRVADHWMVPWLPSPTQKMNCLPGGQRRRRNERLQEAPPFPEKRNPRNLRNLTNLKSPQLKPRGLRKRAAESAQNVGNRNLKCRIAQIAPCPIKHGLVACLVKFVTNWSHRGTSWHIQGNTPWFLVSFAARCWIPATSWNTWMITRRPSKLYHLLNCRAKSVEISLCRQNICSTCRNMNWP